MMKHYFGSDTVPSSLNFTLSVNLPARQEAGVLFEKLNGDEFLAALVAKVAEIVQNESLQDDVKTSWCNVLRSVPVGVERYTNEITKFMRTLTCR
jgi:hypothetical protein